MQGTTLSFANLHNHGALFANIFRVRRESSTIRTQWKLPTRLDIDYDQYDTPQSRWLAVHNDCGEVLAGVRLTPTIAQCGIYSYMIRDAQTGLLPDIPDHVLHEDAPVDSQTWEVTRGFVAAGLPVKTRQEVRQKLVTQILRTSRAEGISRMLALLPSNWTRWSSMCQFDMVAAGPKIDVAGTPSQAVWIDCSGQYH